MPASRIFYRKQKVFATLFETESSFIRQHCRTRQADSAKSSRNTRKIQNGFLTKFSVLWYNETKSFRVFLVITFLFYRKNWTGQIESVNFDVFLAYSSFCPYIFEKENSDFSCAVFLLFQNLQKSRKLPAADLQASSMRKVCDVTSVRWPERRTKQIFYMLSLICWNFCKRWIFFLQH